MNEFYKTRDNKEITTIDYITLTCEDIQQDIIPIVKNKNSRGD